MNVAVTGTGGYLGSHCRNYLRNLGHRVISLTQRPKDSTEVSFHLGQEVASHALMGVDALIHGAYDFKALTWRDIQRINVDGSKKLLTAARAAGAKKIVFISSISAFEGCSSLYGKGKMEVEAAAREIGGIILRPGLIYGDPAQDAVRGLGRISRLPILPIIDDGSQPMVLVHIEDVCRAVAAALAWPENLSLEPVMVAHPKPVPFVEIFRTIAAQEGRRLRTFSVSSRLILAVLKVVERFGIANGLQSDILKSILAPNPRLDAAAAERLGLKFYAPLGPVGGLLGFAGK